MKPNARFFRSSLTLGFRLALAGFVASAGAFIAAYIAIVAHASGDAALPADCAIVFGAAVYGNKYPGPAISRRIETAAALYEEGSVKRLIVSGGKAKETDRTEADVMRALATELGVPRRAIIMEDTARSTWENIAAARHLTSECSDVIGISDGYHLARIEFLSWRQGWGELHTHPTIERPPRASERRSIVREMFALMYYALFIDKLFPNLPAHII